MKSRIMSGWSFALLLLAVVPLHGQSAGCTNAIFQGTYFLAVSGSVLGGNLPVPYAALDKLVADGQGGVTGSTFATQNGVLATSSLTGSYTVMPSCTGSMTLNINSQSVNVSFQLTDNGQGAALAFSTPSEVVAGRAYRASISAAAQCGNGLFAGIYGYTLNGTAAGVPYSEEGQISSDGNGNLTFSSVLNNNGTITQSPENGTYSIASDCSGTAQISGPSGNRSFQIAFIPSSRVALLLETDAGTIVTGLAQPSTLTRAILPDVISGGGFDTSLYFTNQTANLVQFPISFIGDDGNALTLPAVGAPTVLVSVPPQGTAVLAVPNQGTLAQGYASVALPPGVTGYGVIRQTAPGKPDEEAVIPFSASSSTHSIIAFDDTASITAVAIVNPSAVQTTVTVTARDLNGSRIGTATITLAPQAKTEAVLRNLPGLSGIAGARGSIDFSVANGNVAVLALRFDGSDFSAIPTANQ